MAEYPIEVAILAVPERAMQVRDLLGALGCKVPVHWDRDYVGHADAYRAAMDTTVRWAQALGRSHAMLIEDDAVPCQRFLEAAGHVLGYVPDHCPVTFFTRNRAGERPWLRLRGGFINTQACVWPVKTWLECSAWMGSSEGQAWRAAHTYDGPPPMPPGCLRSMNADNWWSEWMRRQRLTAWATVPSLVEHRKGRSVIQHHHIGQAAEFIGDGDPFDIDWSLGAPGLKVCAPSADN